MILSLLYGSADPSVFRKPEREKAVRVVCKRTFMTLLHWLHLFRPILKIYIYIKINLK